jgi:hypothetical protein
VVWYFYLKENSKDLWFFTTEINKDLLYIDGTTGYFNLYANDDSARAYSIERSQPLGSYNTQWYMYLPPSSTDLRWYNGSDLMALTTAGVLTAGSLVTNVGGITLLAGQDIRPSANSTTAINIAQADGTDFVIFDTTNKKMIITSGTPASALSPSSDSLNIITESTTVQRIVAASDTASTAPACSFLKSRGTMAAPTIVASGDTLGIINFQGYDGSTRVNAARIVASVDATPGASDMPGNLAFYTTLDGATSSTERMRITNAGLVGIGTTSPTFRTEIVGSSSGATISGLAIQNSAGDASAGIEFRMVNSSGIGGPNGISSIKNVRQADGSADLSFWSAPGGGGAVAQLVTIDGSSGNVGIGTTSPSEILDVVGDIEVSADIHNLADNGKHYFGAGDDATITYDGTNLVINPRAVGSGATIFNPGYVGIGMTSPSTLLHIRGDSSSLYFGTQVLQDTTAQAAGVGGRLGFGGKYNDAGDYVSAWAAIAGLKENSTTGNYGGYLQFSTRPNGGLMTERMKITSTGDITFGSGVAGYDQVLTFDGETNDGVLTWMEDEDYFQFSDDILMSTTEKHYFRDTAIHISSANDGDMDIEADTSIDFLINTTEQITLTDGKLAPTTNNDIDLGDSTHKFKDGYFAGKLTVDGEIDPTAVDFLQITTPANPAANHNKIYFKADDKLYKLTSAGVETEVGGGGGGGETLAQTLALGNVTGGNDIAFDTNGDVITDGSQTSIDPYNRKIYASDGSTIQLDYSTAYALSLAGAGTPVAGSIFAGSNAGDSASSASYSNFIGPSAGEEATNASYSNFLGNSAGYQATNASNSNFIGSTAGSGAINAEYSNFIGFLAGFGQTSASYSVFIGSNAGNNNYQTGQTDFANNLIIDQSLLGSGPRASAEAIRENALLYGTFAAAAANQQLTINGALNLGANSPIKDGTNTSIDPYNRQLLNSSGTCTFDWNGSGTGIGLSIQSTGQAKFYSELQDGSGNGWFLPSTRALTDASDNALISLADNGWAYLYYNSGDARWHFTKDIDTTIQTIYADDIVMASGALIKDGSNTSIDPYNRTLNDSSGNTAFTYSTYTAPQLNGLTTDGFVKTGSTNGTLSIESFGYTGDLNDSTSTKIADVVNGLITAVYF